MNFFKLVGGYTGKPVMLSVVVVAVGEPNKKLARAN